MIIEKLSRLRVLQGHGWLRRGDIGRVQEERGLLPLGFRLVFNFGCVVRLRLRAMAVRFDRVNDFGNIGLVGKVQPESAGALYIHGLSSSRQNGDSRMSETLTGAVVEAGAL